MNRSMFKNTIALAVPNLLNPVISFLLVLAISRFMGIEGLGQYSLVLSYITIFGSLASMGLGSLIAREVAKRPEGAHVLFLNATLFGTVASLVTFVGMNGLVMVMGYEREVVQAAFIMSLSLVLSTATYYAESVFRAVEKSEYVAFTYITETILRVGICVFLAWRGYGIVALFGAILGTRVLAAALIFGFYVKVLGLPRWEFRPEMWRVLAGQAPVFTSIVIFSTIHLSVDQIMLSKLISVEAVGVYSAADRLLYICRTLPMAFSAALLPFFTKEFLAGTKHLQSLTTASLRYIFLGTMPLVVGTAILSDQIIALLYGQQFHASVPILRLHILSLIPFSLAYIFAEILIATDNQKVDLTINIIAAVINVVLNFILIPHLAEIGAVAATLITIVVFNQLQYRYVKRRLFSVDFGALIGKPLLATIAMGGVTYLLRDLNVFLNITISAAVYFLLVFLLKALSPQEISLIKGLLVRVRGRG